MLCNQCNKNEINKYTKLQICNSCYSGNYRKKYPAKYHYIYSSNKEKAFERDNFKCVICGSVNNIEIHHLDGNGASKEGKMLKVKEQNNHLDNLLTLCIKCHRKVDKWKAGAKKINTWSKKYDKCIKCNLTNIKYGGKGLCIKCYNKEYNKNHKRKNYKKRWYQNRGKILEKLRKYKKLNINN